jgi:hypothetical protein
VDSTAIMRVALDLAGFPDVPPDSAIIVPGTGMRRLLVGIDIGVPELLLARDLGVDGVVAHHPIGLETFPLILDKHVEQMVAEGVPRDCAEQAVAPLKESYNVGYLTGNFDHVRSVAALLGMPLMCIHNPLDELGRRIMDRAVRERRRVVEGSGGVFTAGDVAEALRCLPEFAAAPTRPQVLVGSASSPAGRVVISHAAGTNGRYGVAAAYFAHGVGTVVYIHVDAAGLAKLKAENRGNLVVTGHIAADAVGISPFVAALRELGVEVVAISGCALVGSGRDIG